nr:MAG TPA: LexA repressor [Caudoviricetes sp.]
MRREELGLSQEALAKRMGYKSKSSINKIEMGINDIPQSKVLAFARALNTTTAYLMGDDDSREANPIPPGFEPIPQMQKIPLVGHIACGQPITAEENLEGYVEAPAEKQIDFALTCHGDSMIDAGIHDGDTVYIRKQKEVENGQIAAVRIGGEATLKRVYYYPDEGKIILQAANAAYAPLSYAGEELNEISIEGLLIGFTHWMEK